MPRRSVYSPKLNEILRLHDSAENKNALPLNLGDGVLYRDNLIYRMVRDSFLNLGFRISSDDFCHYRAFPLFALREIINRKVIPAFDNVSVLRELERARPLEFDASIMGLRDTIWKNRLLHESGHCLANHFLGSLDMKFPVSEQRNSALKIVMGEAFALTAELMGNLSIQNGSHIFFYSFNTFMPLAQKRRVTLQKQADFLGFEVLMKMVFIFLLYINCYYTSIGRRELNAIVDYLVEDPVIRARLKKSVFIQELFVWCREMVPEVFRQRTTPFYLRVMHIDDKPPKLFNFDLTSLLSKSDLTLLFLEKAANVLREPRLLEPA